MSLHEQPQSRIELDLKNPRPFLEQDAARFKDLAFEHTGLVLSIDEIIYRPEVLTAILEAQAESQRTIDKGAADKKTVQTAASSLTRELDAAMRAMLSKE